VSSLWTPEGEHPVGPRGAGGGDGARAGSGRGDALQIDDDPGRREAPGAHSPAGLDMEGVEVEDLTEEDRAEMAARLEELQHQLVSTPAELVVANHAYGLFELAAIHLSQKPPRLDDARLAVDAMAVLVEGLKGRLGENESALNDALSQIRLAFVQISATTATSSAPLPED